MINREGKNEKPDVLDILKIGMVVVLIVYIGALLVMNGNSKVPFQTVAKAVEKKADAKTMEKAGARELRKYYGLNAKDYDGTLFYRAKSAMGVEELLLIKVKNPSQAETVEASIERRVEGQKKNFEGYGVEQTKLLNDAVWETKGNYIFLSIAKHAENLQKTFRKSL
ncbi:MAG: DUF4358 domain-containing protein [Lachnospiraceae bacterium]